MTNSMANAVRWTPARIRAATLYPKPKDALAKAFAYQHGHLLRPKQLATADRKLLRHIANHADLLSLPVPIDPAWPPADGWLLVPAPSWLIEGLATFEADETDLELDQDREDGHDAEPDVDEEADDSAEPGIVRPDTMSRLGLEFLSTEEWQPTAKQRERYRKSDGDALHKVKRQLRVFSAAAD